MQVSGPLPDLTAIKSVQRLSWAAGVGMLHLMQSTNEEIHKAYEKVRINNYCRRLLSGFVQLLQKKIKILLTPADKPHLSTQNLKTKLGMHLICEKIWTMYTVKIQMYNRQTFAAEDDIEMLKHVL